jgi:sugar phosphate isomerase/epimerase
MIRSGLATVSFRKLDLGAVARLAGRAGLAGIEWAGDVHVAPGDTGRAREAAAASADQGLAIAGYGSYYRAGERHADEPEFPLVLDSAVALGAPVIRTWAGRRPAAEADAAYRARVVKDLIAAGERAGAAGIRLAVEYHGRTLTDTDASALSLARELDGSNVYLSWQPLHHRVADHVATLRRLAPRLANLHVFQWQSTATGLDRRPLADGSAEWSQYLSAIDRRRDVFALLEFVRDDAPEQLLADAATLNAWLAEQRSDGEQPRLSEASEGP